MTTFDVVDIIKWTRGQQMPYRASLAMTEFEAEINQAPDQRLPLAGLSTDSRKISRGEAFLALSGDVYDGHDYLEAALDKGAVMLIIEDRCSQLDRLMEKYPHIQLLDASLKENIKNLNLDRPIVLRVSDTLLALQQIANGYRHSLKAKVIAITGSVGKTSTREMVACCLEPGGKVHQTYANLNNEIGLPQTLLAASSDDDFIIVEKGMRGLGQIELLSKIANPDISIITNIGWSHLELLQTRGNILKAKTEIVAGMNDSGILIINYDDELLADWYKENEPPVKTALYSVKHQLEHTSAYACMWTENVNCEALASTFDAIVDGKRWPVQIGLPGSHHISNATAGLLTAYLTNQDLSLSAANILKYKNTGKRQRIIRSRNICIMDDSYNAAPESMVTAIKTIASMAEGGRIIAVLAGMKELGSYSKTAHLQVGVTAAHAGVDELYLFGEEAELIGEGAAKESTSMKVFRFSDRAVLSNHIKEVLRPGDYVLIKGSRAFEMDTITNDLEAFLEEQ